MEQSCQRYSASHQIGSYRAGLAMFETFRSEIDCAVASRFASFFGIIASAPLINSLVKWVKEPTLARRASARLSCKSFAARRRRSLFGSADDAFVCRLS